MSRKDPHMSRKGPHMSRKCWGAGSGEGRGGGGAWARLSCGCSRADISLGRGVAWFSWGRWATLGGESCGMRGA